jgi:cation diffusion facilitator CzcD-associated flavoprotein CzcO
VTERCHRVVVVGDKAVGTDMLAAGVDDFVVFDRTVTSSVFDHRSDTWTLTADDGDTCRGRVVLARESPFVPWTPDLFGRRDFRGVSFHAAAPAAEFDPAGRRIAVIGADGNAGRLIEQMAKSATRVKVFPLPPRRVVPRLRRAVRFARHRRAEVVASPVEEVTAAGVRTADGVHHEADAIIYGTGFAVAGRGPALVGPGGLTLEQTWIDGAEPYLGVALHGFPNYFTISRPDVEAAMRDVIACLRLMTGHTRIEARRSAQQVFNERVYLRPPPQHPAASAFDLSSPIGVHDDTYDGPAVLTWAETYQPVRVRLSGRIDPIDGQYHWQGTVFDQLSDDLVRARAVTLAVGERRASARITERTPQGSYSIAGVGAPPYAQAELEVSQH